MTAVFKKSLRDSRKLILWLGLGLGLYAFFIVSFFPSIVDQAATFDELLKSYPKAMVAMFTGDADVSAFSLTEPGSFVQLEFAQWMLLILGAVVIMQVFSGLNGAERDGTMDMMLSLPVARRRFLLARVFATAALILLVLTCCFLGLFGASLIWTEFDAQPGYLALGIYGAFFPLMVVAGFTYLLAALIPSSKRIAGPLAYLFLVGSYILYGFAGAVEGLKALQPLMIYYYYNAGDLITHGVDLRNWLVLGAAALLCLTLAWWFIDHKELGV